MMRRAANSDLCLGTTLVRQTAEHGPVTRDVIVTFEVDHYSPGCDAVMYQRNGDPGWPAEPAEYEFVMTGAEFDLWPGETEPSDAPGPLTAIEIETLREWFDRNHARACEHANDNYEA